MEFAGWLISVVTGLLVLLLLLLIMPLRLNLRWSQQEKSLSLRYMGFKIEYNHTLGLLRLCLGKLVITTSPWPKAGTVTSGLPVTKLPSATPARFEHSLRTARELWYFRAALRRALFVVLRLLGRLIRTWRLEHAEVLMAVGLGDPARTGIATGSFWAIWPILKNRFPNLRIVWQPRFDKPHWEVEADIVLRALPLRLVYHSMSAIVSLPWRELRRLRAGLAR